MSANLLSILTTAALFCGVLTQWSVALDVEGRGPFGPSQERLRLEGQVVDERGQGIAGASVQALLIRPGLAGYIDAVRTNGSGGFAINRQDVYGLSMGVEGEIRIDADHPDFVPARLTDVWALPAGERLRLRIQLRDGRTYAGRVVDPKGEPVNGAAVQAILVSGPSYEKAAVTDEDGRFELRGLTAEQARIQVVKFGREAALFAVHRVHLATPGEPPTVVLKSVEWPKQSVHELLGITFAEIDGALAERLFRPAGLVVLDPGKPAARLPNLAEGDVLMQVAPPLVAGQAHPPFITIKSARHFAESLLAAAEVKPNEAANGRVVRVLYDRALPDSGRSTRTHTIAEMSLSEEDLDELERLLGE